VDVGESRSLTLVANYVDIPEAQDTLGLPADQWRANPKQAISQAEQFNTRKSVEQLQGGAIFEQRFGEHSLRLVGYAGNRQVTQYLAIPPLTQFNPAVASTRLHSGGVVDLDGDYHGGDLRWSWAGELAGMPLEFALGGNYDEQKQLRQGFENFIVTPAGTPNNNCTGTTACGVRGNLRRDESNTVDDFDQFTQVSLRFTERWSLLAGLRHSKVTFDSADRYIVTGNPDDSGRKSYSDTTAVGGIQFRPTETLRLYVSTGDGFETPTFNELAYRTDGQPGLAFDLKPEQSHNYELGLKWRPAGAEFDLALFRTDTREELVVARNSGGRSSYSNVDRSRRNGLEASGRLPLADDWQLEGSYTLLDAEFRSDYSVCGPPPCLTPNIPVAAPSRIPGVPRHQGKLRLGWTPGQFTTAVEFTGSSPIVVNDIGTVRAPGYGLWNADAGYEWRFTESKLRAFVRVENLLDKKYVGSVIVNEANSRYFESGPERSYMAGVQWRWR
jgi:iron complex outermembrane receptor protein